MFNAQNLWVTLTALLVIVAIPDVSSYSKYGRTCKDIGCRNDEVCVIAEDPCTSYSDKCGSYPTCKKTSNNEGSCSSIICDKNEYCRTENDIPKCVSKISSNGFQSAGVDIVNGQQVSNSDTNKHTNTNSNTNPYANANAPPAPADPVPGGTGYHQVNTGTNIGYPSYPSNVGSSNNNNGYPPYPSTNQGNHPRTDNLGYPPYPTMNRMPQPGQGYPGQGYPPYPGQSGYPQAGYPQQQYPNGQRYPVGQYPGYQNYPNQNHRGYSYNSNSVYRKNSSNIGQSASFTTVCLITLALIIFNRS
ncbi:uncharacterized protein DDB_G0283357-like [Polistes fuscatus]|uniref:uncharacterized protein DDB_G0283357-like n=1 Tax=Polistes fuscatus TaxID=30207 RepID=UPI001CA9D330|nr:uncharacterized protein DDB_G0283357-like [Polistes fuscatus]